MIKDDGMIPRMTGFRSAHPIAPPPDVNFGFAAAVVMRGVSEFCYRRSQPPPDPVLWPDQQQYFIGQYVSLHLQQPKAGEAARLTVTIRLLKQAQGRQASWTLTTDEVMGLTALEADHLVRDLFYEVTEAGLIHPIPALRRRVALFGSFPLLPTSTLPVGTRVKIRMWRDKLRLPHRRRTGIILGEIDPARMIPVVIWMRWPPEHIYLVEVHPNPKKRTENPILGDRAEVAYADYEIYPIAEDEKKPRWTPKSP